MATKIRELFIEVNVRGDAPERFKVLGLTMSDLKAAADLAAGAVKAVARAVDAAVDAAIDFGAQVDEIAKTSKSLGVAADSLQRLRFAADRSGVGTQQLNDGLRTLNKNLLDATMKGVGPLTEGLDAVGISLDDLAYRSPEAQVGVIADALARAGTDAQKAAVAAKFFGETAGPAMATLLAEGSGGIAALGDEAERLGLVVGEDTIAAGVALTDAVTNWNAALAGFKSTVMSEVLPVLTEFITELTDGGQEASGVLAKDVASAFKETLELAKTLAPAVLELARALAWLVEKFSAGQRTDWENTNEVIDETVFLFKELGRMVEDLAAWFGELITPLADAVESAGSDAWESMLETFGFMERPLAAVSNFIGEIVDQIEQWVQQLDFLLDGARDLYRFVKGSDGETVITTRQNQTPPDLVNESMSKDRLTRIAGDENENPVSRSKAAMLATLKVRDEAANLAAKSIGLEGTMALQRGLNWAMSQGKTGEGNGKPRGGGRGKARPEPVSNEDLLKIISTAGATGQSLDDLLAGRSIEGTTPPVIAVTITNFNIDQDVQAPVTVHGVPGAIAEDVARIVETKQREVMQREYRNAIQELDPQVRR